MQKIRHLMSNEPMTLESDRPASEAARVMRIAGVGAVLVTKKGRLCGIVTDRDIVIRCIAESADPNVALERICSQELTTISADADVDEAIRMMRENAIRRVPVVDGGRPLGIVSLGDVAVACDPDSTLGEISAAPPNT